jgi:chromosome segregation ATPase
MRDPRELEPLPTNKVLKDIDSNIESSVVQFLEKQCSELGRDLELVRAKNSSMNVELTKLSLQNQKFGVKVKELESEIESKNTIILENNNQLDSITELYNRTTREISRLTSELKEKTEKNRQINELYTQLMKDKEEADRIHSEEIRTLRDRLEELEEENEDYQSRLQVREDIGILKEKCFAQDKFA